MGIKNHDYKQNCSTLKMLGPLDHLWRMLSRMLQLMEEVANTMAVTIAQIHNIAQTMGTMTQNHFGPSQVFSGSSWMVPKTSHRLHVLSHLQIVTKRQSKQGTKGKTAEATMANISNGSISIYVVVVPM